MAAAPRYPLTTVVLLTVLWSCTFTARAVEILGTGSAALVRNDDTDALNDGNEACVVAGGSPLACGFDATFSGNNETFFEGGEGAFNVFDNQVGGGNTKWCCDAPSAGMDDPQTTGDDESGSIYVQAELAEPIVLHAFTLATGNDVQPQRDADVWKLQGSVDGITYADIYSYAVDGTSLFTAANQVLLFRAGRDYATPPAYRYFRYRAFSTVGGTQHHLNELELFELGTVPQTLTTGAGCTLHDAILAANRALAVGVCPRGSHGADTIVLGADENFIGADTSTAVHASHTSMIGAAAAALPDVTDALTIVAGAGSRLSRDATLGCVDADPASFRLLTATAALTLDGLTLEHGCVAPATQDFAQGGALLSEAADLTLRGTTFSDNQARGTVASIAPGVGFPADGGAVRATGGTTTIEGSRFIGNLAQGGNGVGAGGPANGGALLVAGTLSALVDTRFEDNVARGGDASDTNAVGGPGGGGAAFLTGDLGEFARLVVRGNQALAGSADGGGGPANGGGFLLGTTAASLVDAVFDSNRVQGGSGRGSGGPATGGALFGAYSTGDRITAIDNVAEGGEGQLGGSASGGGLYLQSGAATLRNLTLSGNRAVAHGGLTAGSASGGGLFVNGSSPVTLLHATVVGNEVETGSAPSPGVLRGAGIVSAAPLQVGHSLLKANNAIDGSGVALVFDCASTGSDTVTSLGYNRAEANGSGCTFADPADLVGVAVPTSPLADYGCATVLPDATCVPTLPRAAGSLLALDAGSCAVSAVVEDVRELPRPQDLAGYGDGSDDCDIGAFEAADGDGDGALDHVDNCPSAANPGQEDADADTLGDACDACRSSYAPQVAMLAALKVTTGTAAGTAVADVDAENGGALDEGITYAIVGGSGASLFAIAADGTLTLAVDAPAAPGSYSLDVRASDCAGGTTTTLAVEVVPVAIFDDGFEG